MQTFFTAAQVTAPAEENTAAPTQRTITGLAIPWDSPGHASTGRCTIPRGAVALPDDLGRVKLLRGHSDDSDWQPVGRCLSADDTDRGLEMTFSIATTPDGDRALAEVREGVRDALSVEIIDPEFSGEKLTGGTLTAVALVPLPAFTDARVSAVHARHTTEGEATMSTTSTEAPAENTAPAEAPAADAAPLTAPTGIVTAASKRTPEKVTFSAVVDALHAMRAGQPRDQMLTAALADITRSAHPAVAAPAWLGELWSGVAYEREIVPTMTQKKLTGMKAVGWRWKTRPEVGDYAGDKTEIPTNAPETESVEITAARLAGGHDIDRAYWDFNEAEFIASYFRAMAESYAVKSDEKAATFLTTQAKLNKQTKQTDLLRAAIAAKVAIKKATRATATTFLIHPDDEMTLLDITEQTAPKFLSTFGIDAGVFKTSTQALAGHVIAYAKPAVEFYELAGSPIRVDAEHIAHGGRDAALFGYYATAINRADAITAVPFGKAN